MVDGMGTGDDVVVGGIVPGDDVVGTTLVEVLAMLTEVPVTGLLLVVAAAGGTVVGTAAVLETAGAAEPDPAVDAGAPTCPPGGL